jgi:NTE family protein
MVGLRPGVPVSLLDAAPLQRTVQRLIDFDQLARNAASSVLSAVGLVATSYETSRSVVFHAGGQTPADDRTRAIHYAPASLTPAHVLASAAIPVAFPPVRVEEPAEAAGWYCDGGTRLNTPIKPVLSLGADRVVVVGLNSVASPPAAGYPQDGTTPDLFDGAVQYLQALLADPLAHDVATLASTNEAVAAGRAAGGSPRRGRRIPYMFIAPSDRYGLGALAAEVYQQYYAGLSGLRRSADLALLGRVIDPGRGPVRGELFSYLFFAPEYLEAALELGSRDAQRWLAATQDDGPWRHEHQERPTTE